MFTKNLSRLGLAGIALTMAMPIVHAQEHNAATAEQQQNQAEVAERAKQLLDRFTSKHPEQADQPTQVQETPEPAQTSAPDPMETFDPGPTEPFAQTQGLEEPVGYLPDSGFGISLAGIALGFTTLKHHKRLTKHIHTLQKRTA